MARVWEHWRQRLGKTAAARLDDRRRRRIVWALDQYGLDAVLRCLDGYAGSAWHRGENDRGTAYDDLTLWLRDAEHVERGLAMAASAPRAGRAGRAEPARFEADASQASLAAFDAFFADEVAHA